jgi:hypothetical protein
MRLLELRLVDDPSAVLGLHPRVTVLTGLSAGARARLVEAVDALIGGRPNGVVALVETDGAIAEQGPGASAPVVSGAVDVVVRAEQVHAALQSVDRPQGRGAVDDPRRRARIAKARRKHDTSRASLIALDRSLALSQAEHRGAILARDEALAAVEATYGALDAHAWPALDAGLVEGSRVEVALGLAPGAVRGPRRAVVHVRLDEVLDAHTRLVEVLRQLTPPDNAALRDAYDLWRIATGRDTVPSPEAAALADEWVGLRATLTQREVEVCGRPEGLDGFEASVEVARQRLGGAEERMTIQPLSGEDTHTLEQVHEEVLEAERRLNSRFGGSRARKGFDDALEQERIVLDRLGFSTWSAYVMGERTHDSLSERKGRLATARRDLERAEREFERARDAVERDPLFAAALARFRDVYDASVALVGEQGDIPQALRAVRLGLEELPVSLETARAILVDELGAIDCGRPHGEDIDLDVATLDDAGLERAADACIGEVQGAQALHRVFENARDQSAAELGALGELVSLLDRDGNDEGVDHLPGRDALPPEAQHACDAIALARSRVTGHRSALLQIPGLLAEASRLAETEAELRDEVESKDQLYRVTEAIEAMDAANLDRLLRNEDLDVLERYLESRVEAPQQLSCNGRVPIVLDDAFASVPVEYFDQVFEWLSAAADRTQLIVLSDQPELVAWAERLGDTGTLTRDAGPFG